MPPAALARRTCTIQARKGILMTQNTPEKYAKYEEQSIEEIALGRLRCEVLNFVKQCGSMKSNKIRDEGFSLESNINWFTTLYRGDNKKLAQLEEWLAMIKNSVEGETMRRKKLAERQHTLEALKKEKSVSKVFTKTGSTLANSK